jgi:hypothetical protein
VLHIRLAGDVSCKDAAFYFAMNVSGFCIPIRGSMVKTASVCVSFLEGNQMLLTYQMFQGFLQQQIKIR